MNLFCFTLTGSTESIYKPAYNKTVKEIQPRHQYSPALLRRRPECSGSDASIQSLPEKTSKVKKSTRSCVSSHLCDETETRDSPHQTDVLTKDNRVDECEKRQKHQPAQRSEHAADTTESPQPTRLRKFKTLLQSKKRNQSDAPTARITSEKDANLADVMTNINPVLTCMGLSERSEKTSFNSAKPSPHQQRVKHVHEDSEQQSVWSLAAGNYQWCSVDFPQSWTPSYHTCQQPQHEAWPYGGRLSLEPDKRHSDLSAPRVIRSITDLYLSQNTLTRFGRFDASTLMKPQSDGRSPQKQEEAVDPDVLKQRKEPTTTSHPGRTHDDNPPQATVSAAISRDTESDEPEKRDNGVGRHRRSNNSVESLNSLNSGQSSSSGVTSGSECLSNRSSLRLEEEPLSCERRPCGRARVHTDFVPSPYDTESLTLKVGDVIDIIAKPHAGIWTGMLNGRIGNFKFIYVDVLTELSPETHQDACRVSPKHTTTLLEVLKRLSLEEHCSSLRLHGYQTVEDLMLLRERHLTELNVTDGEHRRRLIAAVDSLQQRRRQHSDRLLQNEADQVSGTLGDNTKTDTNCPRDSGCHMQSDSPDSSFRRTPSLSHQITASGD